MQHHHIWGPQFIFLFAERIHFHVKWCNVYTKWNLWENIAFLINCKIDAYPDVWTNITRTKRIIFVQNIPCRRAHGSCLQEIYKLPQVGYVTFPKGYNVGRDQKCWIHFSVCEWCGYELKSSDWISMQECVWSRWCLSLNVSLGGFKWCTLLQNKLGTYYYWYWSVQWTIRFLFLSIRDYHIHYLWSIFLNKIWFQFIKLYSWLQDIEWWLNFINVYKWRMPFHMNQ